MAKDIQTRYESMYCRDHQFETIDIDEAFYGSTSEDACLVLVEEGSDHVL